MTGAGDYVQLAAQNVTRAENRGLCFLATMKILKRSPLCRLQERWYSREQSRFLADMDFSSAASRFNDRNTLHAYFHHYFKHLCPNDICRHRAYFLKNQRGFGENAFHAMWFTLLREFRPKYCLEIGIYRGQVISLWALIAKLVGFNCEVHGISPFAPVGDTVSQYLEDVDYLADTLQSFKKFGLEPPTLVRALSTDRIATQYMAGKKWDLIYIDGSHDYEVVAADYSNSVPHLQTGGLLVMDDASVGTDFRPPLFSFAGHPGPSRVATELAMKNMRFLGAVGHNNIFVKI